MAYANMTEGVGAIYRDGKRNAFPVAANTTIYEGSLVFINSSGYAVYTATEGACYVGVASETCVNGTTAGARSVLVYCEGAFEFKGVTNSQGNMGKTVYLDTSATPNTVTVTEPSSNNALKIPVGKIIMFLGDSKVLVRVTGFALVNNVVKVTA